jgi:hypothetical protein
VKLANILPLQLIRQTPKNQTVHLALVPHVLYNLGYVAWLKDRMLSGHTVILDNPIHENIPIDIDQWYEAMKLLKPTVAVIPDVIDDDGATVRNARIHAPYAASLGSKIMAVPHGTEQRDWRMCANYLRTIPGVSYLGISLERRLKDDELALERRYERLRYISRNVRFDDMNVHLLGTSEASSEFARDSREWYRATSTDTSKYAVFFLLGIPVSPPAPVRTPYPGREPLGGSLGYFDSNSHLTPLGKRRLKKNLTEWCAYAEGRIR